MFTVAGTSFGDYLSFLQDIGDYKPQFAGWLVGKGGAGCWREDLYVHHSGKLGTVTDACCTATRTYVWATEYRLYPVTLEDFATKTKTDINGVKPILTVDQFDAGWPALAETIIQFESGP